MSSTTNRVAWLSVADFMTLQNLRIVLAAQRHAVAHGAQRLEGTRASGEVSGREALPQAIPDGNHGDNRRSIK